MKWPELTDEQAAALKAEHSGDKLKVNDIKLPRQAGGDTVTVVWREPTFDDWDAAQAAEARATDDVIAGNRLLAETLIVWPDAKHVTALTELPHALNRWMAEDITPFFGSGSTVRTREL